MDALLSLSPPGSTVDAGGMPVIGGCLAGELQTPVLVVAEQALRVTVVGRHCESGDVLVESVRLAASRVGDLLGVPATGAYCYTMANNHDVNRRIPVVFVADGGTRLAVRRETRADPLARDVD